MAEERQTNYTIGEGTELPSKGLIYDKAVQPHVELRSMTARDEMKRLSPSSSQFKVLADIIEGCMIEKPAVHVYDMALGDYEYLLHKLRIVTYGPDYKMTLRCPFCGEEFDTSASLEDLRLKDFNLETFNEHRNIILPKSGKHVTLKFQTPRMLDEIEARTREMKRKFPDAEISFELLVALEMAIDTVDGEKLDPMKAESFVNKLPAMDMTKILNSIDELNSTLGVDNKLIIDCTKCGGEVPTTFRFGTEFFRPTNI